MGDKDVVEAFSETTTNSTNPDLLEWEKRFPGFRLKQKGDFDPFLVKLALGKMVIVGDQIQYLQRVQIQSSAAPSGTGAPTISTVSPSAALPGASVNITGANFGAVQGDSKVKFGNTPVGNIPTASWADKSITVTVPNITAGPANIVVSVGGTDSSPATFTVCPASGPCLLKLEDLAATVTHGAAQAFKVTVSDASGVMKGFTGIISFTSSDTTAHLPGTTPGSYQFTTGDAGVHQFDTSHGVTFNALGPQTLTVSAGSVSTQASTTVQ